MPSSQPIPSAILRRLAVEASADPRTVQIVADGGPVKGTARERVRAVLIEHGYLPQKPPWLQLPVSEVKAIATKARTDPATVNAVLQSEPIDRPQRQRVVVELERRGYVESTAEGRLLMGLLFEEEELAAMPEEQAKVELLERGFTDDFIDRYLKQRARRP